MLFLPLYPHTKACSISRFVHNGFDFGFKRDVNDSPKGEDWTSLKEDEKRQPCDSPIHSTYS